MLCTLYWSPWATPAPPLHTCTRTHIHTHTYTRTYTHPYAHLLNIPHTRGNRGVYVGFSRNYLSYQISIIFTSLKSAISLFHVINNLCHFLFSFFIETFIIFSSWNITIANLTPTFFFSSTKVDDMT